MSNEHLIEHDPEESGAPKSDLEGRVSRQELMKLERQLIPLLNTIRKLLGKGPVAPWT